MSRDDESEVTPDDVKPFRRLCLHCNRKFWVDLKFQTEIGPDSPWNICPRCVQDIADGSCSDATFRALGF